MEIFWLLWNSCLCVLLCPDLVSGSYLHVPPAWKQFSDMNARVHLYKDLQKIEPRLFRSLPFTYEERSMRLSDTCTTTGKYPEHSGKRCLCRSCRRNDMMYKFHSVFVYSTSCFCLQHQRLLWLLKALKSPCSIQHLCQHLLRVWYLFFIFRYLDSIFFLFCVCCVLEASSIFHLRKSSLKCLEQLTQTFAFSAWYESSGKHFSVRTDSARTFFWPSGKDLLWPTSLLFFWLTSPLMVFFDQPTSLLYSATLGQPFQPSSFWIT